MIHPFSFVIYLSLVDNKNPIIDSVWKYPVRSCYCQEQTTTINRDVPICNHIPTEQRNCEILKLPQIYKNKRIWCMKGRRGHLQFHTFSRRFVYRWHLTMQGMKIWPKVSNYRRRSQKLCSINCGQDGHVHKTNIPGRYVYPFILYIAMMVRFLEA